MRSLTSSELLTTSWSVPGCAGTAFLGGGVARDGDEHREAIGASNWRALLLGAPPITS